MFLVRLIPLVLWTAYSWSMGQIPTSELNSFGVAVSFSFFLAALVLYFFPMYEAYIQKQPNFFSIFALNLLLGWTLVGWVVALVWALKVPEFEPPAQAEQPIPDSIAQVMPRSTVECPFCAEEILAKARKCKHCGSDVEPVA